MSDEISAAVTLKVENGTLRVSHSSGVLLFDQASPRGGNPGTVGIGTSEDISFGDVASPGFVYVKNLDSTNYVKIGGKSGGAMVEFARLYPGEIALVPTHSSVTWRAVADTAACDVLIVAVSR